MRTLSIVTVLLCLASPRAGAMTLEQYRNIQGAGDAKIATGRDVTRQYLRGVLETMATMNMLAARKFGQAVFCVPAGAVLTEDDARGLIDAAVAQVRSTRTIIELAAFLRETPVDLILLHAAQGMYPCTARP